MKDYPGIGDNERIQTKHRMFSLKRQIVSSMWLFLIVVALLLVLFLCSMISSYQKKADEKRTADIQIYAETLNTNLSQLRDAVGEIYLQNSAFDRIYAYPSKAEKWEDVYNLLNILHIQVKSNRRISGMFLFCDSFDWVQYALNESVDFESKERMKQAAQIALKSEDRTYLSFPLQTEDGLWYNMYMKKVSAAIGGCIDLRQGLPDEKEQKAVYDVIYEGIFYPAWAQGSDPEKVALDFSMIGGLLPGENHIDGKVVYLHQLNSDNLSVAEILPESIWLYVNKLHILMMILLLFYVYAAFRIQAFVYAQLSRPLGDMVSALENIRAGVWEVQFSSSNRILEIEDVRQAVRTLLSEIEQYKIRFYEEELEKARIHRQYLQLQLAPHFYTNCLKNAYYMLALKEYDNAEVFLQRLSVHLRYLLQKDVALVTVEKELDFLRNYVDLQKLMTTKPLVCSIAADDEALDKEIPILALQTFVENSVKYGRDVKGSQLTIDVRVKFRRTEDGNYLDLTVKDNGKGYPQELLEVINGDHPAEKEGMGVGVINLQHRIRLFYGDSASWYFENQNGAVSELILPEGVKQ